MIIGSANLDHKFLLQNYGEADKIRAYAYSLVPEEFQHCTAIKHNQLYFIVMSIRKIESIKDFKLMNKTITELLSTIRVTGYMDEIIEVSSIYNLINMNKVNLYIERLI